MLSRVCHPLRHRLRPRVGHYGCNRKWHGSCRRVRHRACHRVALSSVARCAIARGGRMGGKTTPGHMPFLPP